MPIKIVHFFGNFTVVMKIAEYLISALFMAIVW